MEWVCVHASFQRLDACRDHPCLATLGEAHGGGELGRQRYVVLVHVWACRRGDGFVECSVPELFPFFPFLLLLSFLCRRRSSWVGARGFDADMVGWLVVSFAFLSPR